MSEDTSDLDAQIAKLQELKRRKLEVADRARRKEEEEAAKILITSTPTKKRIDNATPSDSLPTKPAQPRFVPQAKATIRPKPTGPSVPSQPGRSTLSTSLAALRQTASSSSAPKAIPKRSTSFTRRVPAAARSQVDAGPNRSASAELEVDEPGPQRKDDLTIVENLRPGPVEFGRDPKGGKEWLTLEPNSKIRLKERVLSHSELQDHLSGRYYLPPSLLYSVVRLSKDGATYDVPVDGDWVTIAVVAERSDVKISGAKEQFSEDEEDVHEERTKQGDEPLSKEARARKQWVKRRGPRKYINIKLAALPPKDQTMGADGISGDALLQLLLFESDAQIHDLEDGAARYRGGSGGAYERWCNVQVGSVIAVLNPRVLRPMKSGTNSPHPLTMPLAITPNAADAVTLIGESRDLSRCSAMQKDGKRCKAWVDLRVNEVCEFHIHLAVQRIRGTRAEFASATTSFALTSKPGPVVGAWHNKYKFGLDTRGGAQSAPKSRENGGGGATYVVAGQAVNTSHGFKGAGDEHLSEKLGRGRAGKRKRALEAKETEKALSALLERDTGVGGSSTGGKYLAVLRKANGEMLSQGSQKGKGKAKEGMGEDQDEVERSRPFNASSIKRIGFDPTARRGVRNEEDTARRLAAIASLKEPTDRPLKLARPKNLSRSNVKVPISATPASSSQASHAEAEEDFIDLD